MPEKIYEEVEILKKHFSGKYEFLELIGKGGFALVYKVRDLYLERLGAIKILYKEYSKDEETIERFRREAKIYANLEHPNIVPIYDIGIIEGIVFFIMKFIEGETLSKIIRREGKLYEKRAVKIMSELLDALAYIHKKGIIHRDIKPHNIMIDKNERTILADFGIARTLESTSFTKSGAILGTAYYLSPEQAKGLPIDHRVDIYSAGITLYEMLTGELPFKGENTLMVLYQHVNELPSPPSKFNPKISKEIEAIILRSLEKEPTKRFSCAEEVKEALLNILVEPKKVVQPEPLETISIPEEEILKKVTPKKEESLEFKKFKTVPSYDESIPQKKGIPLSILLPIILIGAIIISLIAIPYLRTSLKSIFFHEETPVATGEREKIDNKMSNLESSMKEKESGAVKEKPSEEIPEAEPPKTEPPKTEPPKEELSKKEALSQTEPPVKEPPKKEPPKIEPPVTEPPKKEPPKVEPPVSEPPKKDLITTPSKGALVLTSSHPCIVIVDGKYQYDLPPRRTLELPVGKHNVKFVIEGYESHSHDIEIVGGEPYALHQKFTPYGKILINSIPWGYVKIDGKDYGEVPVETRLSEGEHIVIVEKEGYKTIKQAVKIVSGETKTLNLKLEKK